MISVRKTSQNFKKKTSKPSKKSKISKKSKSSRFSKSGKLKVLPLVDNTNIHLSDYRIIENH